MSAPLRILQLVHGYPPALGGTEFAIRDICERLVARHGAEVTVFTTNAYTNANFRDPALPTIPIVPGEVRNGVAIRRFPVVTRWAEPLRRLQEYTYRNDLAGSDRFRTWWQGPICPGMKRAMRHFEADVVSAACFPLNHMSYPFTMARPRPPAVLFSAVHPGDPWGYERPSIIRLCSKAFATVAFTEAERRWLVERGAHPERVRVIPLGIDPDACPRRPGVFRRAHGIPSGALLVAYVGQQGGHKGIDHLLASLPSLLEKVADLHLAVAGGRTPFSEDLRRIEAGLPPAARGRLTFLDEVTEQEKSDLLEDCDVFCSPSAHESFGITILEAWSHSRPVVVGDSPGPRAIVDDGVTGLIIPPRDREAIAGALVRLAADPGLRARMGSAGRAELIRGYTLDRVAGELHELYLAAAGQGR